MDMCVCLRVDIERAHMMAIAFCSHVKRFEPLYHGDARRAPVRLKTL